MVKASKDIKWLTKNIDLEQEIPSIELAPEYQGIFITFWWRHLPLGYQEITFENLPITAQECKNLASQVVARTVGSHLFEYGFNALPPSVIGIEKEFDKLPDLDELLAIEHPLECLAQMYSLEHSHYPIESISVVVCTRDRPQQLAVCLKALQELEHPPAEIVVVDNAPTTDCTQKLVHQFPNIRYVLEPQPGLSIARNTGIRATTGDIIAFTDDDVEVHPHWTKSILEGFDNPDVMVVTGLILPAELETTAQVVFHRGTSGFQWECRNIRFDQNYFEKRKRYGTPVWQIGAGASMAIRRRVIEQVGDFDTRLGAGAAGCSEDSEFWYRVLAAGWSCHYVPSAVVFHYHRGDLKSLQKQMFAYMRGHVAALLIQGCQHRHIGNFFRLFVVIPEYYLHLLLKGLVHGFRGRYRTVFVEILGCFSGIRFYINDLFSRYRVHLHKHTKSNLISPE